MDTLPEEMLQEIMEYLRYSDLKCFRLVCKKVYEASLAFRIVNRDSFVYGVKTFLLSPRHKFDDVMNILSTTERNFYHFHFVNMEITAGFREFVEKQAEYILSLKFERCEIMYHPMNFCANINECIKLESLKLYSMSWPICNHAATITLPAIETMDKSRISVDVFNVLMDTKVTNLHLYVDRHHHNDVVYTRGRLRHLKCVNLSGICTDEHLMSIADELNLTTIRVDCSDITDRGFKYFVQKQRLLQIVKMRSCRYITDESLFAIAEYLKDLKELIINATYSIPYSFDALNRIINFTPVRSLDCYVTFDDFGLAAIVGDVTVSKSLRHLHLYHVENETYVTYVAENFLSLTELILESSNGVTNETLRLICRNLKNLKKLNLSSCHAINAFENDVPRLTFSANFNNLEELNLYESEWLSDSTLETCFKLASLRILNLAYCEKLTVKSFVAMPKNFPCLEDLNIYGLEVDGDILLSTVPLMKRLCNLTIWVTEPITNHLLNLLYEHSDSLHRIHVYDEVTGDGYFIRSRERKTFVEDT